MSRPANRTAPAAAAEPLNLVAGRWQHPDVDLGRDVCDSNSGEPLMRQRGSSAAQVDAAIDAADAAHREQRWCGFPGTEKAAVLTSIADALQGITDDIASADATITGVPIGTTKHIAAICAGAFREAAILAAESSCLRREDNFVVERLPLGPVAIIGPWNAPSGIACHKLASALAAGCPVLFKPSEWAPTSGQLIASAIHDSKLPQGVFQMLHGGADTGARLIADPRVAAVSFTGGLDVGRAVAATCAAQIKPAQLELGGNNPLVVLPDADLDAAADGVVRALTTLNGQWCRALGRVIVHTSQQDELLAKVERRLAGLRIGHSLDPDVDMGPLAHAAHRERVVAAIDKYRASGADVLQPGSLPDLGGWFLAPTLVTGLAPEAALDEVFGPVATVHGYDSVADAIRIANLAPYGLAAYVFGANETAYAAARQIESGMVKVNTVTLFSPHRSVPRPAWKLSGAGDEGTRETFEFFRGTRVIGVPEGVPG